MKKKPKHIKTLDKEFQKVIADYINDDLEFSTLQINIIEVNIDESLARAIIYYVTHDKKEIDDATFIQAKVRHLIATHFRDKMRRIPLIIFKYDHTYDRARKILKIIKELEKNEKKEAI